MYTLPPLGRSRPPIMLNSVLLPEPLGPMIDTYSPRWIVIVTPLSASTTSSPMRYSRRTSIVRTVCSLRVVPGVGVAGVGIGGSGALPPLRRAGSERRFSRCTGGAPAQESRSPQIQSRNGRKPPSREHVKKKRRRSTQMKQKTAGPRMDTNEHEWEEESELNS